jgi:integrase
MDLQDRFESGALLTLTEVADLDTFCGRYLEEAIAEFPGKAGGVIRLEVRNSKARRRSVNLVEKRNRLAAAIHSFVEYTSADHLSRLHLRPDRWHYYNSVRDNCLQWIRSRCEAIKQPSRNDLGAREGLAEVEVIRLRAVIEPDHPENPFEPNVRFRNYLILRLLLDLGIRRGELLGIRVEDCRLGSTGTVTVHRRPDDPDDPRTVQPFSKTDARILPLNGRLVHSLGKYLRQPNAAWSQEIGKPKGSGHRRPAMLCSNTHDDRRPQTHKAFPLVFDGFAHEHSRKPDEFCRLVAELTPDQDRCDLFSRENGERERHSSSLVGNVRRGTAKRNGAARVGGGLPRRRRDEYLATDRTWRSPCSPRSPISATP